MTAPGDLDIAYRRSRYRVDAPEATVWLTVDEASAALDLLLDGFGAKVAALITAANPRSRQLLASENASRHAQLLARLRARLQAGHRVLPTVAQDPRGEWPDEQGILIAGISASQALDIARAFDQNAILWCEAGKPVQLLWTGAPPSPAAAHLDQHGADDGGET